MRKIEPTTAFKRDFKRESKGQHRAVLDTELKQVITALAADVQGFGTHVASTNDLLEVCEY